MTHEQRRVSTLFFNKGKSILIEIFPLHERQKANISIKSGFILKLISHIFCCQKNPNKIRQSLRNILGYTSTTLKSQYFLQFVSLDKSQLNLLKTQWAMQSRILMYIVMVCLKLLWLETANCVLVFQDWSHLVSLWRMFLNFSRWEVISTTLIRDFHRCICYLMRREDKHINVCMSEDLGVFVSVMHNAFPQQYCISLCLLPSSQLQKFIMGQPHNNFCKRISGLFKMS